MVAEGVGTAVLLATVVGSGVMADRLAGGNDAIALLGTTLATGAILVVLADLVARTALPPAELPLGAVTAVLGVPFFLTTLRKLT